MVFDPSVLPPAHQRLLTEAGITYEDSDDPRIAIQMTDDPSGRRLTGKWLGFGAESEINDGPWTLTRVTRDTRKASLQSYNRPAADKTPDGDDAV
jgi:hypothetical protein